ncbi:MAG: hypothetical protein GW906_01665 [Epsilonproteobacteria bacterium]|nr:hypothetical protein [Campylobacterota bacterium]OIO15446.1 MAG: hypothetical protein AUJ81_07165 [Helicobacteraceae bacterium CG1_02_36_14]PIP10984.1 MAG: hypothetical protein COX50_02995 [Sulfurimonas sp. CG23_combo_of_CG06-09_8_20_14_all_36_33]PIS25792.1 MAG: hypothetical protein COT46_04835 [Sulfurimonas sp. CG08_land_8_20_14_0_20_36_33]PIU34392.1 MAG: hypothetical protein COT05_07780 [Sulfurimonas sp. CG07_land_8_20_14_0_80_36_56]PIV02734.1 MAG: hypothetical protein COS56_10890 [Sulfur
MFNKKDILTKRLEKLDAHYSAIKEYKELIDGMLQEKNILTVENFNFIQAQERALFDAYLKRFTSIQDFLGSKIFPLLLEISGISTSKMTEVLDYIEKEEIIDSLEHWIEIREIRNELEHDYPDELQEALDDLKYCIDNFETLQSYYLNVKNFVKRFTL